MRWPARANAQQPQGAGPAARPGESPAAASTVRATVDVAEEEEQADAQGQQPEGDGARGEVGCDVAGAGGHRSSVPVVPRGMAVSVITSRVPSASIRLGVARTARRVGQVPVEQEGRGLELVLQRLPGLPAAVAVGVDDEVDGGPARWRCLLAQAISAGSWASSTRMRAVSGRLLQRVEAGAGREQQTAPIVAELVAGPGDRAGCGGCCWSRPAAG